MTNALRRHWPLVASLLTLWIAVAVILLSSVRENAGRLVYATDDAYIHMAMAKNFARHGVWGISPYEFSSSSSSILWTLLLSFSYTVFGVNELSPLILNILFASLAVLLAYAILRRCEAAPAYSFLALLAVIFLAPLPTLIFVGLEHSLHTALNLLAVFVTAQLLSGEGAWHERRNTISLMVLAPLVTAARFEGMFLVVVLGGLFALRKQWLRSLMVVAGGFLPIVVYGLISLRHGWYFFPSSVLLKGQARSVTSVRGIVGQIAEAFRLNAHRTPELVHLVIATILMGILSVDRRRRLPDNRQIMTLIFSATALLQLATARVGYFYRYEAYLIALGVLIVALHRSNGSSAERVSPRPVRFSRFTRASVLTATALLMAILAARASDALTQVRQAMGGIFQQHYQIGLFVRQFYQGSAVALNDIGAVNFLADIRCLDLLGLGTLEVTRRYVHWNYHTRDIDEIARRADTRIAVVYIPVFDGPMGGLPRHWRMGGEWLIDVDKSFALGGNAISFFALKPSEFPSLVENLRKFSSRLPKEVSQSGPYTENLSAAR